MGMFDVTARRTAKREPAGFFRWALPRLDPALAFVGWLDARTAPPPPETELTCDALAEFAGDALVFAELPGAQMQWKQVLEGWNVRESQQVLEWQAEARRVDLLRVLEAHCGSKVPTDVASVVQASADPEQLSRWFDVALKVKSYDEFRAAAAS